MKRKKQKPEFFSSLLKSLVFTFIIAVGVGYLMNYRAILVNGWSAEPFIYYRSLIVTKKCENKDYKPGDFVTFTLSGKSYVTHQIVEIYRSTGVVVCKGWNYNSQTKRYEHQEDSQTITFDDIVGKVIWKNYALGSTIFMMRENIFILVALVGVAVMTFIVKDTLKVESDYDEL